MRLLLGSLPAAALAAAVTTAGHPAAAPPATGCVEAGDVPPHQERVRD